MNIIIAKDAGYCFGVRDAVNMAYETAEKYGDVYMLGDIVHNERVVSDLEEAGAKVVSSITGIPLNRLSVYLMIPYLAWCCYAFILNLNLYLLN